MMPVPLARELVPLTFVPMKLSVMRVPLELRMLIPAYEQPEMRLWSMRVVEESPEMKIPKSVLPKASVPSLLVPIILLRIIVLFDPCKKYPSISKGIEGTCDKVFISRVASTYAAGICW